MNLWQKPFAEQNSRKYYDTHSLLAIRTERNVALFEHRFHFARGLGTSHARRSYAPRNYEDHKDRRASPSSPETFRQITDHDKQSDGVSFRYPVELSLQGF